MASEHTPPSMADTSIRVSEELADELYSRKARGESYEEVIWELIEQADADSDSGRVESPEGVTTTDDTTAAEPAKDPPEHSAEQDDLWGEIAAQVPGQSDTTVEARTDAVLRLYNHLREEGAATSGELQDLVDPEAVGYQSARSFWTNTVQETRVLAELPGVEPPGKGEQLWRYRR